MYICFCHNPADDRSDEWLEMAESGLLGAVFKGFGNIFLTCEVRDVRFNAC